MKKQIELDWPILPGSVTTAESRCGKARCACKNPRSPELHGIYYRWTGFIEGKRTTKTLSKDEALECKRRIRNFRKLQKQIEKVLREAVASAPWVAR